jgi:hypothetical protein
MTTPTSDGMHRSIPRAAYERIERVNWSNLRHMKRSPKHYRAHLMQTLVEDTDAMRVGRAVHVATLEPETFRATYAVWDGGRRYGKEWEAFKAKQAGLEILTEEQYELVQAIADAALTDVTAAPYLHGGAAEATLLWTHTEPTVEGFADVRTECKGRVDMAHAGLAIIDLKTTRDASPDAFQRQCFNLDTYAQLAFYQDGYAAANGGEVLPCKIVAVENRHPFVVQVYTVPDDVLEVGRATYRSLLQTLAYCRHVNKWPGYHEGEVDLELPRWARSANDEDITEMDIEVESASG